MRTVKADLHSHLRTTSYWRKGDFNRAANIAQRRLGWGGIIGLVNFSDMRYETFYDLSGYDRTFVGPDQNAIYIPQTDTLIVKGQEVPTRQGHLLVLALPRNVHLAERRDLADTIKEARDHNGTVIADHPFSSHGIGPYLQTLPQMVKQLDAIEVFNGQAALWIPPRFAGANKKAANFYRDDCERDQQGALSSTDGHSFFEVGKCWTALNMPDDYNNFDPANFLRSVRLAPSVSGRYPTGERQDTWDLPDNSVAINKKTPQRLAALTHVTILYGLILGAKLPRIARRALRIQRYYDVPRPKNQGNN